MPPCVGVFCGSALGRSDDYRSAAAAFALAVARRAMRIVYGGASVGLMGVIADTMLAEGGEVIGVIPGKLVAREIAHGSLTELRVVETMHERKAGMAELADAFVALPGGLGTLEELFEVWTWAHLGIHAKPCALLNAGGYYDPLIEFLDHAVREGFVREPQRATLVVASDPDELLDRIFASS